MACLAFSKGLSALAVVAALLGPCQSLADSWVKAETDHFIVYSNALPKTTGVYATQLERYRLLLNQFYDINTANETTEQKLEVYLTNPRQFKEVRPSLNSAVDGFIVPGCYQTVAAFGKQYPAEANIKLSHIIESIENPSLETLLHEYAHQFLFFNSTHKYPAWFIEGFADYYSTVQIDDEKITVGLNVKSRVWTISGRQTIDYTTLLKSPDVLYEKAYMTDAFYAQSWLLTHYAFSTPERRKALNAYLEDYANGADQINAFEKRFNIKVADLSSILTRYMRGESKAWVLKIRNLPAAKFSTTPLPQSADRLLLWNAASKTCPPKTYQPELLSKIRIEAARLKGDDYAELTLAQAEVIIGDAVQGVQALSDYTQRHPADAEAFALLGQGQYQLAIKNKTDPSLMAEARQSLGKAYSLNPAMASNMYYLSLAQADKPDYPNETALNAAIEARNMAPAVVEYALNAARLLFYFNQIDDVKYILYPLANDPHNPDQSRWATAIITAIETGKPKADILHLLNSPISEKEND